jgi:hypothetical protein
MDRWAYQKTNRRINRQACACDYTVIINSARSALEPYKKYEGTIAGPSPGKPFWELYDVKRITPRKEWLDTVIGILGDIVQLLE